MMTRLALLTAVLVGGCAPAAQVATAPAPTQPTALHWARSAAEHRAIYLQTFRAASDRLREVAAGRTAGTWGVILDADETVLDNSEYQRRLAQRGAAFDSETWNAWVREMAADTLPGAGAFIRLAQELGGRVVIVTNRAAIVCDETRRNIERLGLQVDGVLCQAQGESGKNGRFDAVAHGTSAAGLPPLDVVLFVGDNIQDFPGGAQAWRAAPAALLDRFGRDWFMVPNAMYGSWERNPHR